jgi:hypothetical protein
MYGLVPWLKSGLRNLDGASFRTKVDLTRYTEQHEFVFDEVFHEHMTNEEIFRRTALPLVELIFQHGKATCFA